MPIDEDVHTEGFTESFKSGCDPDRARECKEVPEKEYTLPTGKQEWDCGLENMGCKRFYLHKARHIIERLQEQGWEKFIEEMYDGINRKWEGYKDTFQLMIFPFPRTRIAVPTREEIGRHRRVDRLLLEVMRLNKLVPTLIAKRFIAFGETDHHDKYKVYRTRLAFSPQSLKEVFPKERYPNYQLIKNLFSNYKLRLSRKKFSEIVEEIPFVKVEVHDLLKDQLVSISMEGTILEILSELAGKLKDKKASPLGADWEWISRIQVFEEEHAHLYFFPKLAALKEKPLKLPRRPRAYNKIWDCGWENISALNFEYYEVDDVVKGLLKRGWSDFIGSLYRRVDRRWGINYGTFECVIHTQSRDPIQVPENPKDFRRLDRLLLELMRLNRLVPRIISKKRLGYGKDSRQNIYKVFGTQVHFFPQHTDHIISDGKYPNQQLIEHMLSTHHLNTSAWAPEERTFEKIAKDIPLVCIEVPSRLKNIQIDINIHSTLCDIFNALAEKRDAVWEWKERVLVGGKEYARIYFSPNPEPPKTIPESYASSTTTLHTIEWYCGWENITCKQFGYLEVVDVVEHLAKRGWLDFIDEVYDETDIEWGEENKAFDLNIYYHYKKNNNNLLNLIEEPRNYRRVDRLLLETMRLNKLVPRTISKEPIGFGRIGRQRYKMYKTKLAFFPQYDDVLMPSEKYPDHQLIKDMLVTCTLDTTKRSPEEKTFIKIVEEDLSSRVHIEFPPLFQNMVVDIATSGTLCDTLNALAENLDAVWEWKDKVVVDGATLASIDFRPKEELTRTYTCCDDLD